MPNAGHPKNRLFIFCRCSLTCWLLALCLSSKALAFDAQETRLKVFDDVWRVVQERYYDPQLRGLDWAAQRALYRPQAAGARDAKELYVVLRQMLRGLQDSHTRIFTAEEKSEWYRPRVVTVGLSAREIEGQPTVVAVERDSAAARAGLAVGDVILSVDGVAASEIFAQRLAVQSASTPAAARWRAWGLLFDGAAGSQARVEWRDKNERRRSTILTRARRERVPALRVQRAGKDLAVVSFDLFTSDMALAFTRAWRDSLRGARGLVIDLRNNGGGDAHAMTDIISAFLPVNTKLGAFTGRNGHNTLEPYTRSALVWASDAITRFDGPLVLLTETRTGSAAEIFVAALRETGRASVIGTNTCGCVLAINRYTLPDGGLLDVSTLDYRTARGTRLEGQGVAPDENIVPTRRDLLTGRDPVLERALDKLGDALRPGV